MGSEPYESTKVQKTRFSAGFGVSDSEVDSNLSYGKTKYKYVLAELFPKKPKPNARYYIKFAAWDEQLSELREKIIWLPAKLKTDREKRAYAANEIAKINAALIDGKCFASKEPDVIAEPPAKKVLIIPALSELFETKKAELRDRSGGSYRTGYNKLVNFIKREGLENNTIDLFLKEHAYNFRDYLLKVCKNSNRTTNGNMIWVGAFFTMANARGLIKDNPFTGIPPLPETDSEAKLHSR